MSYAFRQCKGKIWDNTQQAWVDAWGSSSIPDNYVIKDGTLNNKYSLFFGYQGTVGGVEQYYGDPTFTSEGVVIGAEERPAGTNIGNGIIFTFPTNYSTLRVKAIRGGANEWVTALTVGPITAVSSSPSIISFLDSTYFQNYNTNIVDLSYSIPSQYRNNNYMLAAAAFVGGAQVIKNFTSYTISDVYFE